MARRRGQQLTQRATEVCLIRFGDQAEDTIVVPIKALHNDSGRTSFRSDLSGAFSVLATPPSGDDASLLTDHLVERSDESFVFCIAQADLIECCGVVERNPPRPISVKGVGGSNFDYDVADLGFSLSETQRIERGDLLPRGQKSCQVGAQ